MIVDFHVHIFPPEVVARRVEYVARDPWFAELYGDPKARMATADDLIASMDADGVDVSVACGFGWRDPGIAEECNSYAMQAMRDYPGRIIGLGAIQPLAGARAVAEVERCARAGMPGIGELMPHGQGYQLSDIDVLGPVVEAMQRANMFLLTHTSEPVGHIYRGKGNVSPADLQVFIQTFPALRIVAAHWGGGFPFYELMPETHVAAANVWYDSAASLYLYRPEIFAVVSRITGPQRILWASDYPLISQRRMLDYARNSGLSEDELAQVLGSNAANFLGLQGEAETK